MFTKILIANRGEIACRIIDTCKRMGVATVAVHSDVDAQARHVQMADQAVSLGGKAPADSYLRGDAIINAALATGAQAIHPGYGFLSENPEFVEAVEQAGLTFVGPSAHAIRAMGLKDAAKDLMARAGVPVVPGYQGANQDPDHLAAEAAQIGYPVLIKAVAGGGGKGMRKVDTPADFKPALEAATSEAQKAFGNAHVLLEKWITTPRHIEVQILGDGTDAIHLFERDCSLQRRHQKVIEEAPAPGMPEPVRAAMGEAAVRAARAIGYAGAGTVEFIVDASDGLKPDGFWFMEMNTRLQVEHPVTECITGLDLVAHQLHIAAGAPLAFRQDQLKITGHAFEARLYAEDVPAGFLPATGRLSHLTFPNLCRADTGVRAGDEISPWYDPMIAKVTVHAPTRAAALQKLSAALAQTEVAGTVTNLAFLRRLAAHPDFVAGDVDTGLIERHLEALAADPVPCSKTRALAAVGCFHASAEPGSSTRDTCENFHLWTPLRRTSAIDPEITIKGLGPARWEVDVAGNLHSVSYNDGWSVDGARVPARVVSTGDAVHVFWGNTYSFEVRDPLAVATQSTAAAGLIEAPMPGVVKAVLARENAQVGAGEPLVILEAMKMEHTLRAARDGRVAEVLVTEGAQVEVGAALVILEEEDT